MSKRKKDKKKGKASRGNVGSSANNIVGRVGSQINSAAGNIATQVNGHIDEEFKKNREEAAKKPLNVKATSLLVCLVVFLLFSMGWLFYVVSDSFRVAFVLVVVMAGLLGALAFVGIFFKAKSLSDISSLFGILSFVIGFASIWPWIFNQLSKAREAKLYYDEAVAMFAAEDNPANAKRYAEAAIDKLPIMNFFLPDCPKSEDIYHYVAYLEGMEQVRTLLNLDRPLTQDECDRAYRALGDAKILEAVDEKRRYRAFTLQGQIYTALERYDEAEACFRKAAEGFRGVTRSVPTGGDLPKGVPFCRSKAEGMGIPDALEYAFFLMRYGVLNLYQSREHWFGAEDSASKSAALKYRDSADAYFSAGLSVCSDALSKVESKDESLLRLQVKNLQKQICLWRGIRHLEYSERTEEAFGKAADCFREALQFDKRYDLAHYNLGIVEQKCERPHAAVTNYLEALRSTPGMKEAHCKIGECYGELDEYIRAAGYLERAVEIDQRYKNAHVTLGRVYSDSGEPEKAIGCLSRAIQLDPWDCMLYAFRAEAEIRAKQLDNAFADLSTASDAYLATLRRYKLKGLGNAPAGISPAALSANGLMSLTNVVAGFSDGAQHSRKFARDFWYIAVCYGDAYAAKSRNATNSAAFFAARDIYGAVPSNTALRVTAVVRLAGLVEGDAQDKALREAEDLLSSKWGSRFSDSDRVALGDIFVRRAMRAGTSIEKSQELEKAVRMYGPVADGRGVLADKAEKGRAQVESLGKAMKAGGM